MDVLRTGLGLVESPRWHDGRLWFSDWTAGEIIAIDDAGASELIVAHASLPLCFDFLADGRPVIVSNQRMALLTLQDDGSLATYADLSALTHFGCNDIVVDGRGNAYVNSPNFEFTAGPPEGRVQPGFVALVTPDGTARVVADNIAFPTVWRSRPTIGRWWSQTPTGTSYSGSISARIATCPVAACGPISATRHRMASV